MRQRDSGCPLPSGPAHGAWAGPRLNIARPSRLQPQPANRVLTAELGYFRFVSFTVIFSTFGFDLAALRVTEPGNSASIVNQKTV